MAERYFYHSFPRRRDDGTSEIDKGCQILSAIKDHGLLLVPEFIEWKQPTADNSSRTFPVLQKRVCFTELEPKELRKHGETFGNFSLEFETATVRSLGAVPVFYVPQPVGPTPDGNAVGVALLATAIDAFNVVTRLAFLEAVLNGKVPVAKTIPLNVGFADSPNNRGEYQLETAEARTLLRAIGHVVTQWLQLERGTGALLNFFYPADNLKHDKLLDYYRQREWRIACEFAINGVEIMRSLSTAEAKRILEIDADFFGREVQTGTGTTTTLSHLRLLPGLHGKALIEMVRRVIVPQAAVTRVASILSTLAHPPAVISAEGL